MARDNLLWAFLGGIIPCMVLRIVLLAPLIYYSSYSSQHQKVIKDHIELRNGTYNDAIQVGENLASTWSGIALVWNIAIMVPSAWFPPPFNLPFLVFDAVTAGYISKATSYQTGYVPHNKELCATAAYSWDKPAGANESFFEATARLNATTTTPVKMCKTFVAEWQYGITLSFFHFLISVLNLIAFFSAFVAAKRRGETPKELLIRMGKYSLHFISFIPKGAGMIVALFVWYLPLLLFRCMPFAFKSKVRFGRDHIFKGSLGMEQKVEVGITELKATYRHNKRKRSPQYQGGTGEDSPLSNFLGIYDMLMAVTEELHYSDLMNLSLVSKSVREVVLPTHDLNRRLETFKRYSCPGPDKKGCWLCHKQICTDCQQLPLVPQATLSHHLYNCRPFCTPCYKASFSSRRPRSNQHPSCECAPRTGHPNIFMRMYNGSAFYRARQSWLPKYERAVCRDCNRHNAEDLSDLREQKSELELQRGITYNGKRWTTCASPGCSRPLGTGPRWWICGSRTCGKECKSIVHKSWGRGEKRNTDEEAVGDEAV